MPPKLPRVTSSEVLSVLYHLGWQKRRVTVPAHRAKAVKPATLAAILDDAGLTAEEFGRLL